MLFQSIKVFLFANSKCKRYFHSRWKPSKLTWTAMWLFFCSFQLTSIRRMSFPLDKNSWCWFWYNFPNNYRTLLLKLLRRDVVLQKSLSQGLLEVYFEGHTHTEEANWETWSSWCCTSGWTPVCPWMKHQ